MPRPPDRRSSRPLRPAAPAKKERVARAFSEIWEMLFTTPVHLDSALSKQPRELKPVLAHLVPSILLRPASQAQVLGVGVGEGEPWKLSTAELAGWRPAALVANRLYAMMSQPPSPPAAIREDFPAAMVSEWERDWGRETTNTLCEILATEPPLGLRARRSVGAAKVAKRLGQGSALPVKIETSLLAPFGVQLGGYAPVLNTDCFKEGDFEIQDEGSQVMALFALWPEVFGGLLQKEPGTATPVPTLPTVPAPRALTVIDACAGAGGKTLALADALAGKGRVYAYDTSEKKLQALRRRATHAKLNNIQTLALKDGNEAESISAFHGKADLVLVDAPCSGWGVLRRNPDIKWRQPAETLTRMPELQFRVLSTYSALVKPGGRLVFGVCTFRKAETTAVVTRFLAEHPDFVAGHGGYLGPGPCDGFYMHAFSRRGAPRA